MNADQRLDALLTPALEVRKEESLYRLRRIVDGPQGPEITADGKPCLNFSSNDYLGLAAHPTVAAAARQALDKYGTGSGAAHLVTGHNREHQALEEELAAFTGRPRALLFSSGYMANFGVAGALLGRGDLVVEDRLNHASLLDAGLLSGARFKRYNHADPESLAADLGITAGTRLVMTDGVFSMDGDIAPLPALAEVADNAHAFLMVDDAHGLGVLGKRGGGTLEHHSLGVAEVPVLMGTLGKAFGTFGAFVAGSETLVETLIQLARTYIYTTAPPPALAAATRVALRLVQEESWGREKLAVLVQRFRRGAGQLFGAEIMSSETPIQPLLLGESERAMAASKALREQGILAVAIRPPTVPAGSARLRITLTAAHTEEQVDRLLEALSKLPTA